jgi:prephenate dehydrogenase (NADP+)
MRVQHPIQNPDAGHSHHRDNARAVTAEVAQRASSITPFKCNSQANSHATQGWSECVSFGNFASYRDRFEKIQEYFSPRFPEATRVGNEMIRTILERTND